MRCLLRRQPSITERSVSSKQPTQQHWECHDRKVQEELRNTGWPSQADWMPQLDAKLVGQQHKRSLSDAACAACCAANPPRGERWRTRTQPTRQHLESLPSNSYDKPNQEALQNTRLQHQADRMPQLDAKLVGQRHAQRACCRSQHAAHCKGSRAIGAAQPGRGARYELT
jgi:hypothetical protein